MEELKGLLRSHGGEALFEFLRKVEQRQAQIVQDEARTKDLGDIRFAAGRREGVSLVVQLLKELKKNGEG